MSPKEIRLNVTVDPGPTGSIREGKLIDAIYVGKHSRVSVDKFGISNLPRGERCKVPEWFKAQCEANKNLEWEFPIQVEPMENVESVASTDEETKTKGGD